MASDWQRIEADLIDAEEEREQVQATLNQCEDEIQRLAKALIVQDGTWTSMEFPKSGRGKRRQLRSVNIQRHAIEWQRRVRKYRLRSDEHYRSEACDHLRSVETVENGFRTLTTPGRDEYRASNEFHVDHPVVWKVYVNHGKNRKTDYYCDEHLPDEYRELLKRDPDYDLMPR